MLLLTLKILYYNLNLPHASRIHALHSRLADIVAFLIFSMLGQESGAWQLFKQDIR